MYSKQQILQEIIDTMVELFEIDAKSITLDAHLYEDLDIDSIDAIDLVVKLQSFIGKQLKPEDFKKARTIQDIVDAVHNLV